MRKRDSGAVAMGDCAIFERHAWCNGPEAKLPAWWKGVGKERGAVRAILSDRSVASVIALALFLNLGTGIVLPILPLFARSFGVDYGQAGLLVGAFYFARL